LEAHEVLIQLLPQIAWLGAPAGERYEDIRDTIGDSVDNAVALAIQAEKYELAVEWMEQGRSIVWAQLLQLRSPLDDLRTVYPQLADEFEQVSRRLEAASLRSTQRHDVQTSRASVSLSLRQQAHHHRRDAQTRGHLLDEIRKLPGFEQFLKPEKFAVLSGAARNRIVVLVNVSSSKCDALIMSPSNPVLHVPLVRFSLEKANQLYSRMSSFLHATGLRFRDPSRKTRFSRETVTDASFDSILADLWELVVEPIFREVSRIVSTAKLSCASYSLQPPLTALGVG
jgi:hypothetical protein